MPVELATGILGNKAYYEQYHHFRQESIRLELQKSLPFKSESEWYKFITGLMKHGASSEFQPHSQSSKFVELFQASHLRTEMRFEDIWEEVRPRLDDYRYKFLAEWAQISDQVLMRLRDLAKAHWISDKIHVHFIGCLYGGFGWNDCIGSAAFPDMDIQKKLLAHELSELITPHHTIQKALASAGLNPGIAHTLVDMFAYFSVKDFIPKPGPPLQEKRGIRPNPSYYPAAEALLSIFENYAENPSVYPDFSTAAEAIVSKLKAASLSSTVC